MCIYMDLHTYVYMDMHTFNVIHTQAHAQSLTHSTITHTHQVRAIARAVQEKDGSLHMNLYTYTSVY